jgi:tRNA G18 (ribose-2'-O)-methylase SpoU
MMNKLVVIAHNIRSLHNVGSIFRTSEGAGVDMIYLTGYTGVPPRKEISKVALGSETRVSWKFRKGVGDLVKKLKGEGYQIVALEQDPRSINYQKFTPPLSPICLIIGNEVKGVSKALLDKSDVIIELPMQGLRKSLNVSVAFGVAIYEISSKMNH